MLREAVSTMRTCEPDMLMDLYRCIVQTEGRKRVKIFCNPAFWIVAAFGTLPIAGADGVSPQATSNRPIIVNPVADACVPQVAIGGGWKTSFVFVNLDESRASRFRLTLADSQGRDFLTNFVGIGRFTAIEGTVPLNGSLVVETEDSGTLVQGFGVLSTAGASGFEGQVAGYAILRQRVVGRPDFEVTVPFSPVTERRMRIAFDNTSGISTGAALVNFDPSSPANVNARAWDLNGNQIATGIVELGTTGHKAFSVATEFPSTVNQRGVLELASPNRFMCGIALRFHPDGAITSALPMSLSQWNTR
jgi:hypothetical protein